MQQTSYVDIFGVLVLKLPQWIVEKLVTLKLEKKIFNVNQVISCIENALLIKEMTEQATIQTNLRSNF